MEIKHKRCTALLSDFQLKSLDVRTSLLVRTEQHPRQQTSFMDSPKQNIYFSAIGCQLVTCKQLNVYLSAMKCQSVMCNMFIFLHWDASLLCAATKCLFFCIRVAKRLLFCIRITDGKMIHVYLSILG